jgi:hypothetical protein
MGTRARLKGQRARRRKEAEDIDDLIFTEAEKVLLRDYSERFDEAFLHPDDERTDPQQKNFYSDTSGVLDEHFADLFTIEQKIEATRADMKKATERGKE